MLGLGVGPARTLGISLSQRFPRATTIIADWYPLLLIPLLYSELAVLNASVWNGHYFDSTIIRWEQTLFNGQPSIELARRFPSLLLSESLHFAYLSYYFIIYGPPLILYLQNRKPDHRRALFAIMLTFFIHYAFFIYYPVQGPRYLFEAPGGELSNGPIYAFTHRLLETGSSRGAAFPSSHVAVSVAATGLSFLTMRRTAAVLTVLTLGLSFGAVYAGFHYAIDALTGFLLGLACIGAAPRVRRWLGGPST